MVDVFGDACDNVHPEDLPWSKQLKIHFLAGWLGGSAGIMVGHPFDTLKVQVQTNESGAKIGNAFTAVRNFGLSHGFFRGLSFPLASQGVLCAMFFAGYGYTAEKLKQAWPESPESIRTLIAGGVGGAVQIIPCCPTEIVKCTLQARMAPGSTRYFSGPFDCLKSIYRERGVRGCFRGLPIHSVRDITGYAIYMYGEVHFMSICSFLDTSKALSPGSFLAGGLAGSLSWFIVTPFDVVKSRIQSNDLRLGPQQFFQFVANIARKEGWRAFFKGGLMSVFRAFPVNTVTLPLYHYCEEVLKNKI